jgi:hypothetical protein
MNTNQPKPLTSFLTPLATSQAPPKQAANLSADSIIDAARSQISPSADISGHLRTSQTSDPGAISPGAKISGHLRTPQPQISPSTDNSGHLRTSAEDRSCIRQNADELATDPTPSTSPNEPPPRFQRSDELMAVAIANGASLTKAAELAGVCEKTAQRHWKDDEFRQRVLEIRSQIRCQAVGELTHDMQDATATLREALKANSESVRVSAARAILKLGPDIGGRAEENARLARALDKLKEEMTRAARGVIDEPELPG